MIKYFCDKCKKELGRAEFFTIEAEPPVISVWGDELLTDKRIMCRECMDAFDKWVLGSGKQDCPWK